jgi:hypothetical protein
VVQARTAQSDGFDPPWGPSHPFAKTAVADIHFDPRNSVEGAFSFCLLEAELLRQTQKMHPDFPPPADA